MEEYILNERHYDSICRGQYANRDTAIAYNTIPLFALYIEQKKKDASMTLDKLRQLIESCPGIEIITEDENLLTALLDDDFRNKYISKAINPFILADYISIVHKDYPIWDPEELSNQLCEYYGITELHY